MQTKMDICITILPKIKSRELCEDLLPYDVDVTDLGNKAYVRAQIDVREDIIEKLLAICGSYGDCSVVAHLVEATPSSK